MGNPNSPQAYAFVTCYGKLHQELKAQGFDQLASFLFSERLISKEVMAKKNLSKKHFIFTLFSNY